MEILVRDVIGDEYESEDAIILREFVRDLLNEEYKEDVTLNFDGMGRIPTTFLFSFFTDLINTKGRDYIINAVNVKNLSNSRDYKRVLLGTAF